MHTDQWKKPPQKWHPETKAAHSGFDPFQSVGAVRPPIFACSTFATETAEKLEDMFARAYGMQPAWAPNEEWPIYTRVSNPNFIMLCERLQHWERGAPNCRAEYFPSGLSAIFTTVLTVCNPGDVLLFGLPLYGGTYHQFSHLIPAKLGIEVVPFMGSDLNEYEALLKKYDKRVKMVFIETPGNPCLSMVDIQQVADLAHTISGAVVAVDNTFMSPVLQHPFEHGADIIVYSGTKSLGGHSDLIAGFVIDRDPERALTMHGMRVVSGPTPSAFDAWLIYRSLDTLKMRVLTAQENARYVAKYLRWHPKVQRIVYPELFEAGTEDYRIFHKQCDGPGSMITFDPIGGKEEAYKILNSLSIFTLAVSLGGVESLAESPWFHTHSDVPEEEKLKSGFGPQSIRLSVGVENSEDLCSDLEQALAKI